jgi:hypothetical protein
VVRAIYHLRLIRFLTYEGRLYQEAAANSAVFINREQNYCEIRGTYTFSGKSFHSCRKICRDKFWFLKVEGPKTETVFIYIGAIDAISHFLLHSEKEEVSPYASSILQE